MSTVKLQGPHNFGGFSHGGQNYLPDEEGVIEVPAHLPTDVLLSHGLKPAEIKKGPKKLEPLAKSAKGGTEDVEPESADDTAEKAKPVKGAKLAKGGDQ